MKQHICKRCGKWHDLFYRKYSTGQEHLMYFCTKTRETFCIEFIPNLPIPHEKAKKLIKLEQRKLQKTLF